MDGPTLGRLKAEASNCRDEDARRQSNGARLAWLVHRPQLRVAADQADVATGPMQGTGPLETALRTPSLVRQPSELR